MRERHYTALIRTIGEGLVLHTLHYADEVDEIDEQITSEMEKIKISSAELRMAGALVKSMTKPLHLEEFKDEFREQLQALVDAKAKGKEITRAPEKDDRPLGRTINLMEALKKSLAAGSGKHDGHNGNGNHGRNGHRHRRSA
jgi:DNA end-binding protein Ku